MRTRHVLLVQGRNPPTYWGFQYCLPYIGKSASLPPLGLVTLAALLPEHWRVRLVDLNIEPLRDSDLLWADVVMVSGMLVQANSMRSALKSARAAGCRTVVGGPAATSCPHAFPEADHLFRGEAEAGLEPLLQALDEPAGTVQQVCGMQVRPDMGRVPVPRFDLLRIDRYASLSVQYSRGCPFSCEFCDIVSLFGRKPRLKSPAQMLAELQRLYDLGYRGSLFFVDDNFIGNHKAVKVLLEELREWQRERDYPFDLYTEASIDLAQRTSLLQCMVEAGFSSVFVGIETPSKQALAQVNKRQNLKQDLLESVRIITQAGLEVFAGFIVGFDSDNAGTFELQREFIAQSPIPLAMVGMLTALPGTALWKRLEAENRLRSSVDGDQFVGPNFEPNMDEAELLRGYAWLLSAVYDPEAYFARCQRLLDELPTSYRLPSHPGRGVSILLRAMFVLGVRSPRTRKHFWKLLWHTLRRNPAALPRAVALAFKGEHLIRYTDENVLPRLERAARSSARGPGHSDVAA